MNTVPSRFRHRTTAVAGAIVLAGTLGLTACSSAAEPAPTGTHEAAAHESGITVDRAWAKSATEGMTSAFGTLENTGSETITLVGAESSAAKSVELHEMAMVDGAMVMRELAGGLEIPAGSSRELAPGGDHLMLMGLTAPLLPGDEFTVTLHFSDKSTLEIVIPVRDTAGADEEYAPGEHDDMDHGDMESEDMSHEGMEHSSDATQ